MNSNLKRADFTIATVPAYVVGKCPYCEEEFEVDYEDFSIISDYPGDWTGETVECTYCENEIIIDDVDWD